MDQTILDERQQGAETLNTHVLYYNKGCLPLSQELHLSPLPANDKTSIEGARQLRTGSILRWRHQMKEVELTSLCARVGNGGLYSRAVRFLFFG